MKSYPYFLIISLFVLSTSCSNKEKDPLPSWNETIVKKEIIDFVKNKVPAIPTEDRIAVFDLDGTIACEEPLWLEMYAAVNGLYQQTQQDSTLLNDTIYQYARKLQTNPGDTTVLNHWGSKIEAMVLHAFKGKDNEDYIKFCQKYFTEAKQPDYHMTLNKTYYPPMKELVEYLKENQFSVYVVSGSLQSLLWSICPELLGIDRAHLIGTRQAKEPVYSPDKHTAFNLLPSMREPYNNEGGKTLNIYNRIGKTPIFAFGNTTGDFGMFRLTSTNTLPHLVFLLNHDDAQREYAYQPWHGEALPAWRDTMKVNNWHIVNMKENFKIVFPQQ
ncbi:MAG: haloacid dehalogenase-like hydrolase [Bacteroides sp.]|jgi:phosphoglycolate phosphatase-like HAD superfamily hydrolase|nr:haloacid dehalogenase-like hydrolase [Bacteroides sp.]